MVAKLVLGGCGVVSGLMVAWAPAVAQAQEAAEEAEYRPYQANPKRGPGIELGGRTGFGLPLGSASAGTGDDFDLYTAGQVPFWFDLGVHFAEHFSAGMYLSYGFGILSDEWSELCEGVEAASPGLDITCSSSDVRLGVQFHAHILPGSVVDPWVGVGTGWEWLSITQRASSGFQSASRTFSMSGFEMFNLQAGVDFALTRRLGLGPFVTFSNGTFNSAKLSCENTACNDESVDIENTASHQWLMFGAKFTARL